MTTTRETTLKVDGMTCGGCVRSVNSVLRELNGVRDVDVNLADGKVRVTHEDASIETMIEALNDAGFESRREGAA